MARDWHVLRGNKRSETAHNLLFFDTETNPTTMPDGSERDHLWFGWACAMSRTSAGNWGKQKWQRFTKVGQFWSFLESVTRGKSRWFVFCHNTSYDLPVIDIFGASVKRGWKVEAAVIEAPPTIITLKKGSVTVTFLDTLNWWRMPLWKIGERIGVPKMEMPPRDAGRAVWDPYCRRDVEVIRDTVVKWLAFLKDNDLGGFASTLASQAFRTFRHRFMRHEIVIDNDEAALKLSREAYTGGRVECFRLGRVEGPIHGLDINSMYPAVLRGNKYPSKLLGQYPTQAKGRWRKLVDRYCIVARCTVRAAEPCYPLKTGNGLCFPLGEFETVLCTPEIALAMDRGELLNMRDIAVYEAQELFTEYVDYFWARRREAQLAGDEVGSWLFKIIPNSFYGKWGQTGQVYETNSQIADTRAMRFVVVDYSTKKVYKCRQLGGLLQVMSSEGEARDSFPAIAAHTTSYARALLWKLISHAGPRWVLYCDTDSLYVTPEGIEGLHRWIDPSALGMLKSVGVYPWINLHGLKDYELPGTKVRKGVRADAIELGPNTFQQTQWSSLKGLVGKGDVTAPTRKQIVKHLSRVYKKGRGPA